MYNGKVGTIIPHTFIPRALILGARTVQEKWGYDWSYVRTENPDENTAISDLLFRFSDYTLIIPTNFPWGYGWCHVGDIIRQMGV